MIELSTLTDDELHDLVVAARNETERRQVLATTATQVDQLTQRYAQAVGRKDGDTWQQPVSAVDAYPSGAVVEHGEERWVSLVPANVWEPGAGPVSWTLWKRLTDEQGTDPDTPPPAEPSTPQWAGEGVQYAVGDLVLFEGKTYRCRQAHTSQPGWTPVVVPALWEPLT